MLKSFFQTFSRQSASNEQTNKQVWMVYSIKYIQYYNSNTIVEHGHPQSCMFNKTMQTIQIAYYR